MSTYLVTYHGAGSPDPSEMESAKAAFGAWLAQAGAAVTDPGAPLRSVGQIATGSPEPLAAIAGYSLLETGSLDELQALLADHPFVTRGGTLQINEVMTP